MREWAISYFGSKGSGLRLGVKDLIDVEGTLTSAGSRLVLSKAIPAASDALLLRGARDQGAQIVAKTNLNELAFGATGINPWFGTPPNPLNPYLIPGGSSSGSAVGVATGELDVAFGTDTGGSIRIPSACCGVFGLKTTSGRVPLDGVWPLAPSLDTVGPMASDSKKLALGMMMLEPEFTPRFVSKPRIGIVAGSGPAEQLTLIERILLMLQLEVDRVADPGLGTAWEAGLCVMMVEALESNGALLAESHRLDPAIVARFGQARQYALKDIEKAIAAKSAFQSNLGEIFAGYDFLALPTLKVPVPTFKEAKAAPLNANTLPFNLVGLPAVSIPVFLGGALRHSLALGGEYAPMGFCGDGVEPMPVSVQVVGKPDSEEELVGLAQILETLLREV
ncbi:MAG: amidase [Actinomycetota bacterium]|nr:amidase [Actinomycetota bacterium]